MYRQPFPASRVAVILQCLHKLLLVSSKFVGPEHEFKYGRFAKPEAGGHVGTKSDFRLVDLSVDLHELNKLQEQLFAFARQDDILGRTYWKRKERQYFRDHLVIGQPDGKNEMTLLFSQLSVGGSEGNEGTKAVKGVHGQDCGTKFRNKWPYTKDDCPEEEEK